MSPAEASAAADRVGSGGTRLVVVDADACLGAAGGQIPAEMVELLDLVRACGHRVLLSTDRPLDGLLRLAARLGISEGYAVCSHGALTVRLDPALPGGCEPLEAVTFTLDALMLLLEDLQFLPEALIAVEDAGAGAGWRVNHRVGPGLLHGEQEQVALTSLIGERTSLARLRAAGISQYRGMLSACTGLTVTVTGPDSCDVAAAGVSVTATSETACATLGFPDHAAVVVGDDLPGSVGELVPAGALEPGLSPLAAQLTAAVITAPEPGSEPAVVVRVWHGEATPVPGSEAFLAGADAWVRGRHGWVRHAPIPAVRGATMRDVERAARDAGLSYPRGFEGRRRAWWRTTPALVDDDGHPAGFNLPLTHP